MEQSGRGAAMISVMYDDAERSDLAFALARAMLAGPWTQDAVAEAAGAHLLQWPTWLDALALPAAAEPRHPSPTGPRPLARIIETFLAEHDAWPTPAAPAPVLRAAIARAPRSRRHWPVARIPSTPSLAATLELSDGQLAWLADIRSLERTVGAERLRNYRYAAVPRRSGLPRVIEAPKMRLKEVQRWILRAILDHVPVHDCAQGFARRRSVIDHARVHSGHRVLLRLDLADFFASVSAGRVFGIFQSAGYEAPVAHVLTGLTTNVVPQHVWNHVHAASSAPVPATFHLGRALATPHLPQGAPTSPALANLAAFRLDRRLAGLAASAGLRYSRYADDLAFSGARLARGGADLEALVATIVRDEGFALNADKSVLRTAAARQSVCGVVVNARPNIARGEYDWLKAILHNAARHGPASQGAAADRAHLEGRVAWVASLNPRRGEKLKRRLAQIDWSA
jgi:RNA-directed DNA polymerase